MPGLAGIVKNQQKKDEIAATTAPHGGGGIALPAPGPSTRALG